MANSYNYLNGGTYGSLLQRNYFGLSELEKRKQILLNQMAGQKKPMYTANSWQASTINTPYTPKAVQKKDEFLQPIAATLGDVLFSAGHGLAKGVEGIMDAGGTVGAWIAKLSGNQEKSEQLKDWVATPIVGDYMDVVGNALVDAGSYVGTGTGGNIVRGIASGVGQMLPSVAAAIITGGGSLAATGASQAASLATLGTSAFGGGVEEALGEGASLGKATLYGAGTAGVELLTERLVGGAGKAVFGAGMLDDVIRPLAKTGAGRVAAEMIGEGVEEGLSEIASPALKSIYKGVDAFSEYGEKDYWSGVGEAALIGAGTSAAFGGTVGHVMGTSGKAADVASLVEDIQEQQNKRTSLFREGEMSEGDTNDRKTSAVILDDVERIEKILKKSSTEERASLIKRYNLSGIVENDGSVRQDLRRSLLFDSEAEQTLTENQNAPQSEKTGLQSAKKYISPGLWRNSQKVETDLETISRGLSSKTGSEQKVQLHTDELSEGAQESYNVFRRAAAKLSEQSGSRMQFAIVDAPEAMKGVRRGDTVYLNASTLEDGKWAKTLLEEATHFTQGTKEAADFYNFLGDKESDLFEKVAEELTEEGNAYGFTEENIEGEKAQEFMEEVYGHASAEMLTNAEYIDKLTRADRTLAEKIKNRISDVADSLRGYVGGGSFEVRKQLRRANKAVSLFEDALEVAEGKGGEVAFLFAGKNAKTADKLRLATAEKMLEDGVDSETIRKETGWHKGYDGEWRFEIDDSKMKYHSSGDAEFARNHPEYAEHEELTMKFITGDITKDELERLQEISGTWGREKRRLANDVRSGYVKLQNMIDHDILFEAYPQLRDVKFTVEEMPEDTTGSYSESQNLIRINSKLSSERARKTLIHEIQHVIQSIEGFAEGTYVDESQIKEDLKNRLVVIKAEQRKVAKELDAIYAEIGFEKYSDELMEKVWNQELELEEAEKLERAYIAERSRKGAMLYDYKKQLEAMAEEAVKEERAPFEKYQKTAGEIEARDAAYRADLSEEERKNTRPDIDREDVVFAENSELSKEFLGWTADGVESYKTGKAVSGMPFAEKEKKFKNDFLQQFKGRTAKFERNGHTYYARFVENKKGLGEFIHESSSTRGQSDETGYRAKIRLLADGDIFKIVEDGEYKNSRAEKGKRTASHKNSKYWDYFWKEIFVDGAGYDVVVNVRNDSKTGNLSDKTRFVYSISFVSNGKRATPVTVPPSKKSVSVNLAIALDNSIPQNSEKSTPGMNFSLETSADSSADSSANQQTGVEKKKRTTVEDVARELEKHANVKRGHRNELLQQLSSLYNDMETAHITAEEMDERVREIADFILSNRAEAKIGRDSYMQEVLDTIKQSKVTLTEAQKAEVRATNDNFNAWRSQMMGGVNIVNKGTPLDVLWDEWAEKYPNIFQDVSETDMPGELLRIYKEAKESTDIGDVERAELYDADAERIAAELPAMIADAFWKVDKKITPEYRAMLKAIAEKEEVRQFWKEKYSDTVNRNKALYGMAAAVDKIGNLKRGKYVNASNVKNAAFDTAIKELAAMNWRGKVISPEKVRKHFSELAAWYTPKNALYGVDGKPNEQYKPEIATALAELSAGGKEGLTVDEIRTAVEVIKYFAHEIEAYGTIYKDGKRIDAMPIAKEYITRAEKAAEIARRSGWITSIYRSKFARLAADPMFLMREADGFQEGGFFSEQFEQLRKGTIRAAVTERKLLESFENFWSGKEGRAYIKRYHDTEVDFYGKKMPLAEAISLYMTLKRDHTVAGAAYAGFEIEVKEETINVSDGFPKIVEACRADVLKELQPEKQLTLDEQDLALVEQETLRRAADEVMKYLDQSFSERDRELIRITEEIMEKCRDYKVNVDMALQGETNVTGGYYYPAKRAGLAENVDSMSMFEGDRVSNLSINKETVKNAHKLLIEPVHVVLMRHVKAISLYDGIGIFTDNLNRLYNLNTTENRNNPTTIRTTIARSTKYAKEMAEYFKEIKQDVEGISKKRSAERFYNDAIGYIRSVYAPYQLGTNPKTWVVQFSSMIASMNILDADSVVKGLAVSGKDVDEYCDLAWLRNNDGAAVLAQSVSERKNALQRNASGVMQKIKDIETLPIGLVDRLVVEELFGACQVQIEKDGGAKIGTEENKKAAGELLGRVILETQQNSLATERTAAMRSGDELLKGFNMFLADSMKLGARFIEPFAEMEALRAQVRIAKESGNTAEIKQLEAKIEKARKKSVRSTSVLVGVSVYNALIAYAFKWLFRRDDEENVLTFIGDVFGNMIGGVPFVRDIYTFFKDGFETENFAISTFNNLLQVTQNTTTLLIDAAQGKDIDQQTVNKAIRDVLYTAGQLSGVSVRNLYNNVTGIINRVSPEAGYWIDSNMYAKSYSKDLEKALDAGDDKMVSTITSIMLNQDGGDLGTGTRKATSALISAGYSGILPRSTPDVLVGADDIEIELNKKQRKQFEKIYSASYEAAEDLTKNAYFKRASKDVQAKALKFVYDTYYQLAKDTVLGQDSSKKNVLFAEAIPVETLAIIVAMASELKADTDKKGNAIAKSRMHKIEALIESLNLSKAQKYMMMGYLGYKNQNGKEAVERYIRTLPLSNAEKQELLEMSGY